LFLKLVDPILDIGRGCSAREPRWHTGGGCGWEHALEVEHHFDIIIRDGELRQRVFELEGEPS
jgi:hypothetical protein